jgi:hypothetical protein
VRGGECHQHPQAQLGRIACLRLGADHDRSQAGLRVRAPDRDRDQRVVGHDPHDAAPCHQQGPQHGPDARSRAGADARQQGLGGMDQDGRSRVRQADDAGGVDAPVRRAVPDPCLAQDLPDADLQQDVQRRQQHGGGEIEDRVHVAGHAGGLPDTARHLDAHDGAGHQHGEQAQITCPDGGERSGGADRREVGGGHDGDHELQPAGESPQLPPGNETASRSHGKPLKVRAAGAPLRSAEHSRRRMEGNDC